MAKSNDVAEFLELMSGLFGVTVIDSDLEKGPSHFEAWDSLMHLRIVAEVEERFGVEIPIDKVPDLKTLSDFLGYVTEK